MAPSLGLWQLIACQLCIIGIWVDCHVSCQIHELQQPSLRLGCCNNISKQWGESNFEWHVCNEPGCHAHQLITEYFEIWWISQSQWVLSLNPFISTHVGYGVPLLQGPQESFIIASSSWVPHPHHLHHPRAHQLLCPQANQTCILATQPQSGWAMLDNQGCWL